MSPRVSIRLLPAQSDGRLVELAGRGHERAFETLVQRYRRPLLRYCRRMGLSDARAEDVLQHSLTKAWLALSEGKEVRELRPWLYRIVHNDAVNSVLRAPAEHDELTDMSALAPSLERVEEGRREAHEALANVASLPQMQRHAIVLTAIEGHSHHEAARALGITDGAVRGLLHRARTTLRSAAAAVTPPGLVLRWRGLGGLGERASELSVGGGAVGATGVLLKGLALTATVGLLALGSGVERSAHRAGAAHHHALHSASATSTDRTVVGAQVGVPAAATSDVASIRAIGRVRGHAEGEHHRIRRGGRSRGMTTGTGGEGLADLDRAPNEQQSSEQQSSEGNGPRSDDGGGHGEVAGRGGGPRRDEGNGGGHGRAEPPAGAGQQPSSSGHLDATGEGPSERGEAARDRAASEEGGGSSGSNSSNAAEQQSAPSDEAGGEGPGGSTRGGGDGPGSEPDAQHGGDGHGS
jgi:RNA polymerase sigma factor (sigma-70 family)